MTHRGKDALAFHPGKGKIPTSEEKPILDVNTEEMGRLFPQNSKLSTYLSEIQIYHRPKNILLNKFDDSESSWQLSILLQKVEFLN